MVLAPCLQGAKGNLLLDTPPACRSLATHCCSGHTTAATFICGTLLFVLLPAVLATLGHDAQQAQAEEQEATQQQQQDQEGQQQQALSQLGAAARRTGSWVLERRLVLWGAAVGVTAAGRVAADAHWCSDVLAGALLGIALTGLTAQLCDSVESGALPLGQLQLGGRQGQETNERR